MNFDLKLTKIDILSIILLSVLFFSITAWNVGKIDAPVTNWKSTTQASFYVDFGSSQQVQTAYFWVKTGNATVTVYSGTPQNWSYVGNYSLLDRDTDYSVQQDVSLYVNSQFLRFDINAITYDTRPDFSNWGITNPTDIEPSPIIEITEIGLSNPDYVQVPITGITALNDTDQTISALADEQNSLEIPPTYMSKMYFDEVYFARSAENIIDHVIPKERTHPPLGKLIQAMGVLAFGQTPFGWRIMGVIFGTLLVPLMFLLGKKLFNTWIGGFSASFLLTFDFMHFTMARIGTTDTYVVFFSLLAQLFFLVYFMNVLKSGWKTSVWPLFIAVVCVALGFSTKWFVLYGAIGLLALLFAVRIRDLAKLKATLSEKYVAFFNHPFLLLLGFIGVFAAIYFATYIPEMLLGDSPLTILNLQNAMLSFHAGTVTDSASAPWWSWPLMFRLDGINVPRWFDITYLPNGVVSTITAFGNPAVWWTGFIAMLVLIIEAFHIEEVLSNLRSRVSKSSIGERVSIRSKGWDRAGIYITVVFLFSWLPYVFIGRATYIYHYYLSVPLICLALTYFINKYWHKPLGKIAAIALFTTTVAMFVAFYPVISGSPSSSDYIHNLKWFPSWFFAP